MKQRSLLMLLLLSFLHVAKAQEAYAVFHDGTLNFYYDTNKNSHPGTMYTVDNFRTEINNGWGAEADNITTVNFDASFANYHGITNMAHWFSGCKNLIAVNGTENLNTENVTNMWWMFASCESLESIDLSHFNTANVTNMEGMFYGCQSLKNLDLSSFNTEKVESMDVMFDTCWNLKSLDLSSFNTEKVRRMDLMFYQCEALTSLDLSNFKTTNLLGTTGHMFHLCRNLTILDLSNFDTSGVDGMGYMFNGCRKLQTIYAGSKWSTENVENGSEMFTGCNKLVGGNGTTWSADHTDYVYARIDGGKNTPGYFTDKNAPANVAYAAWCPDDSGTGATLYFFSSTDVVNASDGYNGKTIAHLWSGDAITNTGNVNPRWDQDLDVRNNTTKVVFEESFSLVTPSSFILWFYNFKQLTNVEGIENLNSGRVTDMSSMFYGSSSLKSLDLTGLDTKNVTSMSNLFRDCNSLVSLNLKNLDTSNVKYMSGMFMGCNSLTSIDLSDFNTKYVTNMNSIFKNCSSLTNISWGPFSTDKAQTLESMFEGCDNLTELDISSFNTSTVTSMWGMFQNCQNLKTIKVGNGWTTSNVTASDNMFNGCATLVGGKGTTYDANHVDATYAHIDGGTANPGYLTDINASQELEPIEGETTVVTDGLGNEDLSDNVVDDVYYNVGDDGYDASDGSIVIGETTNMAQITDATPGSSDIVNNFTGLIMKVAAGKGTITVNAKTTGNAQLVVQVGNQTPMIASRTEQGDVIVSYDVAEDTYVYIYAIIGSSAAPAHRAAPADAVKIYGITVTPGATGISIIQSSLPAVNSYYTLDGRKMEGTPTKKGIYIVNGRRVVVK